MKNKLMSYLGVMILMTYALFTHAGEVISAQVNIGSSTYSGDWYMPDETPTGLVYLQHGFSRNAGNLRNLGNRLMDDGYMVLSLNVNMAGGNPGLAPSVADAIANGTLTPPNGVTLPSAVVIAGHSAGALHSTIVGAELAKRNYSGFSGVILFDPVDADNLMAGASQSIVNFGRPVYAILARGGLCNSNNNSESLLANLDNTEFVGFKLTNRSTHIDAEGTNAGFFARLFCGRPTSGNISYIQDFASAWAGDMLTGSQTNGYYPGGDVMDGIVNGNLGYLLK